MIGLIGGLIVSVIALIAWTLVLVALLRQRYAELTEEQAERLEWRLCCYAIVAVTMQVLLGADGGIGRLQKRVSEARTPDTALCALYRGFFLRCGGGPIEA